MAMLSFSESIQIQASPQRLYEIVADLPSHIAWNHQPVSMEPLDEGPPRVGSRYLTEEQSPAGMSLGNRLMMGIILPLMKPIFGTDGRTVAEITALEAPSRVAWQAHLPSRRKGDLMRMRWEIQLSPEGEGTRMVQSCEIDPPAGSPFAGMVAGMEDDVRGGVRANLALLKEMVEG